LPDVAGFPDAAEAMRVIDVYIGDRATVRRSLVRHRGGGHAPITAQLRWCEQAGVHRAVFTHCGSAIVRADARGLDAALRRLGDEHGVAAGIACDGYRLSSSKEQARTLERTLEEGLRESFPASDAVAITEPATTAAGEDEPAADTISPRERA
jgi:hypothetical protein